MAIQGNKNTATKQVVYFKGGINENVQLTKIERTDISKDGSGKYAMSFTFLNEGGGEFKLNLFDINEAQVKKYNQDYPRKHKFDNRDKGYFKDMEVTDEDAIAISEQEYQDKLINIWATFVGEDNVDFGGSFEEMYNQTLKALSGKFEGVKVRLLLIYNGNSKYLDIPRNGLGFIERMTTTPSKVSRQGWMKIDPPASSNNPSHPSDASTVTTQAAEDDLPF